MEIEDGITYLEETTSVTKLDSFMIFGGEPMLFPERAIKLFHKANELGVPKIELITNGSWGDDARAKDLALKLKASGVNEVLISVDAFHFPYIPLQYPRNAALASLAAGIEKVVWNVAFIEGENAENRFDKQTKEILRTLVPLSVETHTNKVWPQGRARTTLKQFFSKQSLEGKCPEEETALVNPSCVTLDSRGFASICWNLSIGNAKKEPLSKLLTDYHWKNHPVVQILVEKGPKGLVDLPEAEGFKFEEDAYIDRCHLCFEIRRFLRPKHPNMFVET